jgi:hypothetical protein
MPDVAETASTLPVPNNPPLKDFSEFSLFGKAIPRLDLRTILAVEAFSAPT